MKITDWAKREDLQLEWKKAWEENQTLKKEIEKSKIIINEYEVNNLNSGKQIKQLKEEFQIRLFSTKQPQLSYLNYHYFRTA
jgi:hypothetical protein